MYLKNVFKKWADGHFFVSVVINYSVFNLLSIYRHNSLDYGFNVSTLSKLGNSIRHTHVSCTAYLYLPSKRVIDFFYHKILLDTFYAAGDN